MKIGISLLSARTPRTGVENVAFNLLTQLSAIESDDEYVVYADRRNVPWISDLSNRFRVIDVAVSNRRAPWIWEHLFFLNSSYPKEVDVVHLPIGGGVVGYGGKFVLTIHDLIRYSHRELVNLRRHLLWRLWCKENLKKAAKIITVSEYVKKDILREFPVPSDRIRVVYNGVNQRFMPCARTQAFRDKYNLPEHYVLFVGTTSPNKNIKRAIDAITTVREKYSLTHKLIVVGQAGEDDAELKRYASSNNLRTSVSFLNYVDDEDLVQMYSNADLFLFPSLTEGFGIPPLEAMRCGIPVVASASSSLPEVLGNAAIWVNPLSVESISEGVAIALLNKEARSHAIAAGFSRAAQFSWEKMAGETLNVYHEAALSQ